MGRYRRDGTGGILDANGTFVSACSPPISTTTAGRTFTWPTIRRPARFYQNRKNGKFVDIAMEAGCALSADGKRSGMGVSAADLRSDGTWTL